MGTKVKEIWKDIPSLEGYYQASNQGRIKSLDRFVENKRGVKNHFRKGRLLKITLKGEYLTVVVSVINAKHYKVHQLVAMAFLGHKPNGHTLVVNHKDLNKLNNRADNLEIVTSRENCNKKHIPHSSKYTGVFWRSNRKAWVAKISIANRHKYLGQFQHELDANNAYQNALKEILSIPNKI